MFVRIFFFRLGDDCVFPSILFIAFAHASFVFSTFLESPQSRSEISRGDYEWQSLFFFFFLREWYERARYCAAPTTQIAAEAESKEINLHIVCNTFLSCIWIPGFRRYRFFFIFPCHALFIARIVPRPSGSSFSLLHRRNRPRRCTKEMHSKRSRYTDKHFEIKNPVSSFFREYWPHHFGTVLFSSWVENSPNGDDSEFRTWGEIVQSRVQILLHLAARYLSNSWHREAAAFL